MAAITLAENEKKTPSEDMILKIEEQCIKQLAGYLFSVLKKTRCAMM
jgi:hypothetical protein